MFRRSCPLATIFVLFLQWQVCSSQQKAELRPEPPLSTAEDYVVRGQYELRLGYQDKALLHADMALALKPNWAAALRLRTQVEPAADKIRDFTTLIELNPKGWRAYANRAWYEGNNPSQFIADMEKSLEQHPEGIQLINFAYYEEREHLYEEAKASALRAIDLRPIDGCDYDLLAKVSAHTGDQERIPEYRRLAAMTCHYGMPSSNEVPLSVDATKFRAMSDAELMLRVGDAYLFKEFKDGLAMIAIVLERRPDWVGAWIQKMYSDAGLHNCVDTEADATKIIALSPSFSDSYRVRAACEWERKDTAAAIQDQKTEIEHDSGEEYGLLRLGQMEMDTGKYADAAATFRRALEINGGWSELWAHLAGAQDKLRQYADEVLSWRSALIGADSEDLWTQKMADALAQAKASGLQLPPQ